MTRLTPQAQAALYDGEPGWAGHQRCMGKLRWVQRAVRYQEAEMVLQQLWEVTTVEHGNHLVPVLEWRDVPTEHE